MVDLWHPAAIERSWLVLNRLRDLANFVVIGGWGVYFWARKLRSRDIDIYIDQDAFYRLHGEAPSLGASIKRNPRLKKFEALIDGVEVDIYTPFMCNLVVPCLDVFRAGMLSRIEGFNVAAPEVLLLLKAQAAKERWRSEKGLKDRADIISLLAFVDIKFNLLRGLLERCDRGGELMEAIRRTLRESRSEYGFLGLSYERDGIRLRRELERNLSPKGEGA
jgi:hypothetical protein